MPSSRGGSGRSPAFFDFPFLGVKNVLRGGAHVKVNTIPTLSAVRMDVMRLEEAMGDWLRPLQFSKQILIDGTKRAFYSESDPRKGDTPWPDWSPDYKKQGKKSGQRTKLRKSGLLFRSVTNPNNWRVHKRGPVGGIELNTARLDATVRSKGKKGQVYSGSYWRIHQFGRPPGFAGRGDSSYHDIRTSLVNRRGRLLDAFEKNNPGDKAGLSSLAKQYDRSQVLMPQRGYIAGGAREQKMIQEVFDGWANDVIKITPRVTPSGKKRLTMRTI